MTDLLWLIPFLPLAAALLLLLQGERLTDKALPLVAVAPTALSALITLVAATGWWVAPPPAGFHLQTVGKWFVPLETPVRLGLYLDPLSLVMAGVVTVTGSLILLYSTAYMAGDSGVRRFFAYMNLFVAAMLLLVLADNLLLLYLGWEGVGLCSYLLIGFWYTDPANGAAARKAFVMTRLGDTALLVGLLILFNEFGSFDIQTVLVAAGESWSVGAPVAVAVTLLLLGGAVGKSAQVPLQGWLPDAMAGPTPVSALIHAATMVTAGVYLIARLHDLFALAPPVSALVGWIGAATLLLGGLAALAQTDIKRILAYSTMSQIGYMFLALGAGAWSAAIFHLATHALFKALLFLAAGVVITSLGHEQRIARMGGLRRPLPWAFAAFLVGGAALAALPFVTGAFFSKELILAYAWEEGGAGRWLWGAGVAGAVITSLYVVRLVSAIFLGQVVTPVTRQPGRAMLLPMAILALLTLLSGLLALPVGDSSAPFLVHLLDPEGMGMIQSGEGGASWIAWAAPAAALLLGAWIYRPSRQTQAERESGWSRFWRGGAGFDRLYALLVVRPFKAVTTANRGDIIDRLYDGLAASVRHAHKGWSASQNGQVRRYATWIAIGSAGVIALAVFA